MDLQKFIDLLESQNISYQVRDLEQRHYDYESGEFKWEATGDMEILVPSIGKHFVNFWFAINQHTPDHISFTQRYNCAIGTVLRSWNTGYTFFKKLEAGQLTQIK